MLKSLLLSISTAGAFLIAASVPSFADDAKTVTISGDGKCAKCALKETEKCQNVIQAKEDGKTVTYYIAKNELSDKFHKNVCSATKKVTAKGTVKEVAGKKELTISEIKTVE